MKKLFETNRLFLRNLTRNDVDDLLEFFGDVEAMRYMPAIKTRDGVEDWISLVQKSYVQNKYGPWAVIHKRSGQFLGYGGLYLQEDVNGVDEVEILYGLIRQYWGKGYATEAASGVYEYGKNKFKIDRFISLIDSDNNRSIKVAEKMGMEMEDKTYRWEKSYCLYSIDTAP